MLELLAGNSYVFYGIILLASILSTAFGIGGFVLIPLFALVYGPKAGVGIITLYFLFQNVTKVAAFREHIDWNVSKRMIYWLIPGAIAGAYALSLIPDTILSKILGIFILLYLANDVFKLIPKKHYDAALLPLMSFLYGAISGLTGAGTVIKGPLLTSIGLRKESYNGTYALTSFFVNTPKLIVYVSTSVITFAAILQSLPLLLVSIAGTYIGKHLLKRVSENAFYYFLNVLFALSAIVLIFQ